MQPKLYEAMTLYQASRSSGALFWHAMCGYRPICGIADLPRFNDVERERRRGRAPERQSGGETCSATVVSGADVGLNASARDRWVRAALAAEKWKADPPLDPPYVGPAARSSPSRLFVLSLPNA